MNKENKKQGWILLHRSLNRHWIWQDPEKLRAWLDILLECNHSEKSVMIGMELMTVQRGGTIKSMKTWAQRWGWSRSKVMRFFKCLENDSMVTLKPNNKTTHLTVCNYDSYQDYRTSNEHQMNIKRTSDEHQTNTNKEVKELKETKESNKAQKINLPFASEPFKASWLEWEKHRQEIKKKLTPMAVKKQFNFLASLTEQEAIESIETSIQNGYTGLFPPKNSKPQKQNSNWIKNL